MDLYRALPALRQHHLLRDKSVALIGVSTIVCDATACYFELNKPKYWRKRPEGGTAIGVAAIGGTIESGEGLTTCLRRETEEELGARIRIEHAQSTYLIHDWQVVDTIRLPLSKKRPTPLMVILLPPRLGGAEMPDHLAIAVFRTTLRNEPAPHDLFGLLRLQREAVGEFFARDEWPLQEVQEHPAMAALVNDEIPEQPFLRPVLTARALQTLIRTGHLDAATDL
ncbi:MAG: NUDIX hydrolase [Anaerolineales bacterium]|nr:NUDIX hydrolase [Anaerolineales bacterium]